MISDLTLLVIMTATFFIVSTPDAYLWNRERSTTGAEQLRYRHYRNVYAVFALVTFFAVIISVGFSS